MIPALDELLPDHDHRERHERHVTAPPEAVWTALQRLTLGDMPLARVLVGVRYLPARLAGHPDEAFGSDPIVERPPIPILVSEPGCGQVLAGVRQPWRVLGHERPRPVLDPSGFRAFDEEGWAKVAMDVRLKPHDGGTRLSTETRIRATDRRARLAFRVYWLAVRPGSSLIRHEMLVAIDRLATAGSCQPARRAAQGRRAPTPRA